MAPEIGPIERLGAADVDALTDLADARGWGRTPLRWALTLGVEHSSAWGIRADGGGLLATVSLHEPPGGDAIVGAMLVAESFARQGLGSALLATVIAAHEGDGSGSDLAAGRRGSGALTLFATPIGQPLYERHGFVTRERIHVHHGPGPQGGPGARARGIVVGPAGGDAQGLAALTELDGATGVGDRSALLAALAALPGAVLARTRSGTAAGLAWPHGGGGHLVGPVAAVTDPDALGLVAVLASAAREAGATSLRLDASSAQVGLRAWCSAHAMPEVRVAPGMVRIPDGGPGAPGSVGTEGAPTPAAPSKSRRTLITQGFG